MLKSGNLMGGTPKTSPPLSAQDELLFTQASICFSTGQKGEAFIYFSRLGAGREHPAVLYNLALCHFKAGTGQDTLTEAQKCLEKTLALLPAATQEPAQPVMQSATFKSMLVHEAKTCSYQAPMSLELAKSPEMARIRVLRLLIDVYAASGQWSEVIRLSGSFGGTEYLNVTAAVVQARRSLGETA